MAVVDAEKFKLYMDMVGLAPDDLAIAAGLDRGTVSSMLKENKVRASTYKAAKQAMDKAGLKSDIAIPKSLLKEKPARARAKKKDNNDDAELLLIRLPTPWNLEDEDLEEKVLALIIMVIKIIRRRTDLNDASEGSILIYIKVTKKELGKIKADKEFRKLGIIPFVEARSRRIRSGKSRKLDAIVKRVNARLVRVMGDIGVKKDWNRTKHEDL